MEEMMVKLLLEHGLTVSTAESCTGGLIASKLVNVSGVSACFQEGFITYSEKAKIAHLSVNSATLTQYGVVSPEVAREMALGVMKKTKSDTSIATTGLAGPDGGTEEKPVGLVYIGIGLFGAVTVYKIKLDGNRQEIREKAANYAINQLRLQVLRHYENEKVSKISKF